MITTTVKNDDEMTIPSSGKEWWLCVNDDDHDGGNDNDKINGNNNDNDNHNW